MNLYKTKYFIFFLFIIQMEFNSYSIANERLQFKYISQYNSLNNNIINFIYKDSRGFMWFCTDNGLNSFDGYNFKTYYHNPDDSTTISDDMVICIYEDESNNFWVGTQNGLNLFDPVTNKFTQYELDKNTAPNIQYNWVTAIIGCSAGGIWISSRSGLYRILPGSLDISWIDINNRDKYLYQSKDIKFVHYTFDENDDSSLNDNGLYCLFEDKQGMLWAGSDNGGSPIGAFHKLMPGKNSDYPPLFKKYIHDANNPNNSVGRYLQSIYQDRYGNLWIGSWLDGLYKFNTKSEKITRFIKNNNDPQSINSNNIFFMKEDSGGNLWISTYGGGLNKIEANQVISDNPEFIHYLDEPNIEGGLYYQNLRSIFIDEHNQLWIGTYGNGAYKTRLNMPYKLVEHETNNPNSLSNNRVYYIYSDSNGNIWAVSKDGILNKWERRNNKFKHYLLNQSNGIKVYNFPFITEYENNLLIAYEDKIYKLNLKTDKITNFLNEIHFPDSLTDKSSAYQSIYVDKNNNLLLSNSNFRVLVSKNESSYKFKVMPLPDFLNFYKDSKSNIWFSTRFEGQYAYDSLYKFITKIVFNRPNYNGGYGFVETKDGFIWASTSKGLMQFNPKTEKYSFFQEKDGLISNDTHGILLDQNENIWLTTSHGLSIFNPGTLKSNNLDERDGLPITNFNSRVFCKGIDGEFYLGSDQGILTFHPDSIKFNQISPKTYITKLKINNKEVNIGEKIEDQLVLQRDISYTDEIVLSHKSNVLLFEFIALNYLIPSKNKYAYKLEGLENDWNYINANQRFATYSGLPYGDYVFKVKAANNDGLWNNEGASLKFIILPPWWLTLWFKSIMVLFILSIIYIWHLIRVRGIKIYNKDLEIQIDKRTKQLQIVNKELEAFAYSVSHDLRAPLRSIDGFSQALLEDYHDKIDSEGKDYLNRVRSAAQRMAQLIDDLLKLSRISRNAMNIKKVNLSNIAHKIMKECKESSPNRIVDIKIQGGIIIDGDEKLINIAMANLLENAWKFTSKHKRATIEFGRLNQRGKRIYFVKDDGAGFNMKYKEKLFGPFQRLHSNSDFHGLGIGLATVQRIIHRHGGQVWAKGEIENGATFYFTFDK